MILAADVGGTKTNVGLFRRRGERVTLVAHRGVRSRSYPSLEAILKEFVQAQRASPSQACMGVPGPVVAGECAATNLPWIVNTQRVGRALGLSSVTLLNDLEATAYGVETLPSRAFALLNAGEPQRHGTKAIIAAGTGLGEAALVWDGARYRAVPSEGGHTDFAPRSDVEVALWRYLSARLGHVSYERILSGPGKVDVYRFLKATGRGKEPAWVSAHLAMEDPSPRISELGLSGRSPRCREALKLFVSIYGAEAGNLALKVLARGGVYVGGGIAPTILPMLNDGTFMRSFADKGRLAPLLARIPVYVILDDKAALYGAASYAARPRDRTR